MGRVWSASFNHVGAITDGSWFYGNSHTSYHVNNALSYAASVGPVSMQIDALMDRNQDTDSAVDSVEFGLSVDLGDIGKVGLAHQNQKDMMKTDMVDVRLSKHMDERFTLDATTREVDDSKVKWRDATTGAIVDAPVSKIMHKVGMNPAMFVVVNDASAFTTGPVIMDGGKYYAATCNPNSAIQGDTFTDAEKKLCDTETEVLVSTTPTDEKGKDPSKAYTGHAIDNTATSTQSATATASVPKTTPGSKSNHIAVQLALGPVTGYLGHSTTKMNGSGDKDKVTHYGLSGGLGDSGFSFHAMGRKVEPAAGMESSPWLIGVTKGLGGGASAMIEHGNSDDGNSGTTRVGLKVDF